MHANARARDYLIVTALKARQAEAYQAQREVRRGSDVLRMARAVLVVPDPGGRGFSARRQAIRAGVLRGSLQQ
jgi:hypothetical protein